jgi:hypothetical protein
MQQSNQPPKYVIPFAQNDASKATIPPTSADDTRASQSQGFPPRTGLPPEAGGVPPQKADMNGALNQLAGPILWSLAGGRFPFDNAFASDTNIGGYPLGSNLPAADGRGEWYSTSNDNLANPDTSGTGWVPGYHYGATALTGQTGGNVTLTPAQAAKTVITVTGTLTSNLVLIVPAWVYGWTLYNNTSGAFSVSVRTASGSAAAIPQNGAPTPITCDGTNCSLSAPNIAPATSGSQAVTLDQMGGRLLRSTTLTASGNFTPLAVTRGLRVRAVGGGGAGGSVPSTDGSTVATASAGGSAGQFEGYWTAGFTPGTPIAITIGAAGLPNANTAGGNGGDTVVGTLGTAPGGRGGQVVAASTAAPFFFAAQGGAGTLATITGAASGFTSGGQPGLLGYAFAGVAVSGQGASTPYGCGGNNTNNSAGGNATGYGASGAGAATSPSGSAFLGGRGAPGIVIIEEYA